MQKFFVEANQIKNNQIFIKGTDVNHISKVLRYQIGDKIQVGNKQTRQSYTAVIEKFNRDEVVVNIIDIVEAKNKAQIEIDLYQGLPKADKLEWIIQKTTELGIHAIIPVAMERSIVKIQEKEIEKKLQRWQKIAEVAAKQSKREEIPEIFTIIPIEQVIKRIEDYDFFLVAYEEEKKVTLKEVLQKAKEQQAKKIGILIGPEGGISLEEIEKLCKANTNMITLGKRILRTETAPIAMTSIIMYELE